MIAPNLDFADLLARRIGRAQATTYLMGVREFAVLIQPGWRGRPGRRRRKFALCQVTIPRTLVVLAVGTLKESDHVLGATLSAELSGVRCWFTSAVDEAVPGNVVSANTSSGAITRWELVPRPQPENG